MIKLIIPFSLMLPILLFVVACHDPDETVLPTPTPSNSRDISIEVISGNEGDNPFKIGEIFTSRHHEGFVIWTHQANFWQPGDEFNAGSLDVNIIIDDAQIIEPFVSWSNGSIQNGENGNGYFLASPMNIAVNTSALSLGQHSMTVQVTNPRGQVFEHAWDFIIKQRESPRLSAPLSIMPTIEYQLENPQPTPDYFSQNSSMPFELDRFSPIGTGEGLCFVLTDTENSSQVSYWDEISVEVDGTTLESDQFGMESELPSYKHICFTTDFLAAGIHLAEVSFILDSHAYSYTWVFEIE